MTFDIRLGCGLELLDKIAIIRSGLNVHLAINWHRISGAAYLCRCAPFYVFLVASGPSPQSFLLPGHEVHLAFRWRRQHGLHPSIAPLHGAQTWRLVLPSAPSPPLPVNPSRTSVRPAPRSCHQVGNEGPLLLSLDREASRLVYAMCNQDLDS